MMDSQPTDQQQMPTLYSQLDDAGQQHTMHTDAFQPSIFHFNSQATPQPPPMAMNPQLNLNNQLELLGNMMALQGMDSATNLSQYNPQLLLEQHVKLTQLQQLQQLQNHIFQQQIALISGGSGTVLPEPSAELQRSQSAQFSGLPTPGSSTELRPQQNTDYVSPMILHYMDTPQEPYCPPQLPNPAQQLQSQSHFFDPRGFNTAPAHIAFNSNSQSIPLPAEVDFDISPLTSPWLGANQQSTESRQTPSNKRTASASDEDSPEKKRISPAIRPTIPKKPIRGYKSMTSTPMVRSTRSRKGSTAGDPSGSTPSPVDLSMPPPAPPTSQVPVSGPSAGSDPTTPNLTANLTPVTPASIMNLGKFNMNRRLAPATDVTASKPDAKGKAAVRPKAAAESAARRSGKKSESPSLKAILPAGSNQALQPSGPPTPQPLMQVRKTSHKAAEQKRRDSLKTTFDDLRGLLPPIPLPSDENFPDERILPGALPPRGPPKTGGEGPNKGVSKLQLLMCGNDYIRQLKARTERRDEEIEKLRREVMRLREYLGDEAMNSGEDLDLERDLDACEPFGAGLGGGGSVVADDEGEEDGDEGS